jgi:hypothetical protein
LHLTSQPKALSSPWPTTTRNVRVSTGSIGARKIAQKLPASPLSRTAFEKCPATPTSSATTTFIKELKDVGKIQRKQAKIATVANRVRDNTLIWDDLDEYLTTTRVPYVAALREAQNYVRAYTRGLGIFELPEYLAWPDWDEWEPLTAWLRSKRSQP